MKKGLALLLCVCLALTALAGCSGKTKEMQKVTVCEVTHSIFYAPQYVALAKGFFADEGLDVELSNGGGADKVMSAVLSGNVDIGFARGRRPASMYTTRVKRTTPRCLRR